ncbi:MAG: Wzz/FepE/Etk N-terminal domain-containing protein [Paracoccaceae bacterium]
MILQSGQFSGRVVGFGAIVPRLLRQFWVIALVVTVGAVAALAYGHMQIPTFEASAVVQVRDGSALANVEDRLTSRTNLLAVAARQAFTAADDDQMAVGLRRAIAFDALTSDAGRVLGFAPQTYGIVISVQLQDAEQAARVANDLAQQILDLGGQGQLEEAYPKLAFYRGEEARLWQEVRAMQTERQAPETQDVALDSARRLELLQDQYEVVRHRLAEQEVAARLADRVRAGQFSLLIRATSARAVSVDRSWMLLGMAGSLLLAVTLAFVLERRYPALQRGQGTDLRTLRARIEGGYRMVDDPKRPIWGLPRFAVLAGILVAVLIGLAVVMG